MSIELAHFHVIFYIKYIITICKTRPRAYGSLLVHRYDWIIVGRVWEEAETHISQTAAGRAGVIYFARRKIRYLWQDARKIGTVVGWRQILGPFVRSAQLWESA